MWGFVPKAPVLLMPRATNVMTISIPREAVRFQVGLKFRKASLRDRIIFKLPSKMRHGFSLLLSSFISGKDGAEEEIWSGFFQAPSLSQPVDFDDPRSFIEPRI